MAKCPRGVICADTTTVWLGVILAAALLTIAWRLNPQPKEQSPPLPQKPSIIVVQQPPLPLSPQQRPDIYAEPVTRGPWNPLATRGEAAPYSQVGVLTAQGGSSSSAAPDRTVLPLYGRELDARRGRWNYYTRTDGTNPVQVPVRVRNRVCDDDYNGCEEISDGDAVHVPVLGRAFTASVYRRSIFS